MTRTRMVVLGILLLGGCVSAWKLVSGASLALVPRQEFVIHEWGTFSTVSGSDGVARKFYPTDEDLPRFVHGQPDVQNAKGRAPVLVSMETPVLYFYSDRERTASVQVDFPEGRITEWYPQASQLPNRRLTWNNVKVFPKDAPLALKQEEAGSRYFAARATDASPVQVQTAVGRMENEKFLFYRGVGDFKMPISFRALGGGRFKVRNEGKEAIPALVLVRAQGGKVHFKTLLRLSEGAEETIAESTLATTTDKLGDEVARLLAAQGLYEKEARAMVKTWQSDWFSEEGTRVLYVVPRPRPANVTGGNRMERAATPVPPEPAAVPAGAGGDEEQRKVTPAPAEPVNLAVGVANQPESTSGRQVGNLPHGAEPANPAVGNENNRFPARCEERCPAPGCLSD